MKAPDPVRVELGRSRLGAAFIVTTHLATAALLALVPGDPVLRGAAAIAIGAHALSALRAWPLQRTRRAIVAVEIMPDRRAALIERGGHRCEGAIRAESYVGAWLTTLVVRPDGARLSRAVAILPDMLPADDLRRLRVMLLHGASSRVQKS
jgi:hypothetical protein